MLRKEKNGSLMHYFDVFKSCNIKNLIDSCCSEALDYHYVTLFKNPKRWYGKKCNPGDSVDFLKRTPKRHLIFNYISIYRGSSHYADFGTSKKLHYAKFALVGL